MSDDDRSLADEPDVVDTQDATGSLTADDFDFDAWLGGARPTRRAVQVFARADLVADMEEIAAEYDRAEESGATASALRAIGERFTEARDAFYGSGSWFVLEARSGERIEKVRKDAAARHGIKLPPDDAEGDEQLIPVADFNALQRAVIADAIVSPSGVTEEKLARMASHLPTEYVKLDVAMKQANSRLAEGAAVLSRDFSRGRSGKNGTAGSKRR